MGKAVFGEITSLRNQVTSLRAQLKETERQRDEAVSLNRKYEEFIRDVSGKLAAANEELGLLKSLPAQPHDPRIDPRKGDRVRILYTHEVLVIDRTPAWVIFSETQANYPGLESIEEWRKWTDGAEVLPHQEGIP